MNTDFRPPSRFGLINSGLYRGSYPILSNFAFLSSLSLRTIVSLIPETPNVDLVSFCQISGINLISIQITRTTNLNANLLTSLLRALSIIINKDNYPLYLHCLDGRRITGLLVILLRRLQQWSASFSLAEYWKYQLCWRSTTSVAEIERTSFEIEKILLGPLNAAVSAGGGGLPNAGSVDPSATAIASVFELILPDNLPRWIMIEKGAVLPGWKFLSVSLRDATEDTNTPVDVIQII